jgi:hypothetical protein
MQHGKDDPRRKKMPGQTEGCVCEDKAVFRIVGWPI